MDLKNAFLISPHFFSKMLYTKFNKNSLIAILMQIWISFYKFFS